MPDEATLKAQRTFFRQKHILHIKCRQTFFIPQRMFSNHFLEISAFSGASLAPSSFGGLTGGESFTFFTPRGAQVTYGKALALEWGALTPWSTLQGASCLSLNSAITGKGNSDFYERSQGFC